MILKAQLLKALLGPVEWFGRITVFNRDPPLVGSFIPNKKYGDNDKQVLDIIAPYGSAPFPVLIYVHGGGFILGCKDTYTRIARCFAKEGYLTFNVNHRLAPEHSYPAHLQDVAAAIYWVCKNAQDYGGDVSRIFLAGDSAGALMVSWYAAALSKNELFRAIGTKQTIPRELLKGLVLFYGVYDLETVRTTRFLFIKTMTEAFLGKDTGTYAERAQIASSVRHITEGLPPTFVCAGEPDSLFSQSLELQAALQKNKVPHETLFLSKTAYRDARHAFLFFYKKECAQIAMRAAVEFLNSLGGAR